MDRKRGTVLLALFIVVAVSATVNLSGQDNRFNEDLLRTFSYRNLGPYRASGWIADIAVPEKPLSEHLYTFYVASRTGGLWKTVNNGTTFQPVFDEQAVLALGDVAVARDPRGVGNDAPRREEHRNDAGVETLHHGRGTARAVELDGRTLVAHVPQDGVAGANPDHVAGGADGAQDRHGSSGRWGPSEYPDVGIARIWHDVTISVTSHRDDGSSPGSIATP